MKVIFSIFFLFFLLPVAAQKHTVQVLDGRGIGKILLSSDEIYNIRISSHPGKEIKIITDAEGEYYNDISLDVERRDQTLFLNSRFREILQSGYDKLSAHKVFSMEVVLQIPEGLEVEVNSNVASVFLKGDYKNILIQLKTGSCYFENFEGAAVVKTYEGNITGGAKNFISEANSRHGQVEVPQNSYGIHKMVLTSINGDIKLTQTK